MKGLNMKGLTFHAFQALRTIVMAGTVGGTLLLFSGSAQAVTFTLDFMTDAFGNPLDPMALDTHATLADRVEIGSLWSSLGINIETANTSAPLGLFNTNCQPKGGTSLSGFTTPCEVGSDGDNDLATGIGSYGNISYNTAPQGNALIFEENPGNGIPDDIAAGGKAFFLFDQTIVSSARIGEIGIIDDANGTITVNYLDGTPQFTQSITNSEENQLQFFTVPDGQVESFSVEFDGSGAISGVIFTEFELQEDLVAVPEPVSGVGAIVVLGLGMLVKRMR